MVMTTAVTTRTNFIANRVLQVEYIFYCFSHAKWLTLNFYGVFKDLHAVTTNSSASRSISASRALSTATWNSTVKIEVTKSDAVSRIFQASYLKWIDLTNVILKHSQTDDSHPPTTDDQHQYWHDDSHQLHGRRCSHSRSRLASQLGSCTIQMHYDVRVGIWCFDLQWRTDHRPGRLQLWSHQRQGPAQLIISCPFGIVRNK